MDGTEIFIWIFFCFFFLLFIAAVLRLFYQIIAAFINFYFRHYINRYLLVRQLKPEYRREIIAHSLFYKKLSPDDQRLFERRVQKFINMKEFIPRGELLQVTPQMKALIAASAIQITFGYPGVYFLHFWKILVYNTDYYSLITQKYHQGEVNTRGLILISWESFMIGLNNPTDGRNLGLHEMAHALRIENAIRNYEYDFIDFNDLVQFEHLANEEIQRINGGESMFRSYAGTNTHELFAIAVENFFERPERFRDYNPELFLIIGKLLKQDALHPHH